MSDAQTESLNISSAAEAINGLLGGMKEEEKQVEQQAEAADKAEAEALRPEQNAEAEGADDSEPAQQAEAEPEAEAAPAEKKFRVEIDGEEREVTADELVEAYRAKPQKLSQAEQQIQNERAYLKGQLEQLVPALQQAAQGKYANVDWVKLARDNPSEYVALKAEFDADIHKINIAKAEHARLAQQEQQNQTLARKQWLAEQEKQLVKLIPEWSKDMEKAKAELKSVRSYLVSVGVPKEQASQLADAVSVATARKAMLWDAAQKNRAESAKAIKDVPPVQKPGAKNLGSAGSKAQSFNDNLGRLKKTGRIEDAAAAMRAFL